MERAPLNQETLHKLLEISRSMAENRALDPLLKFAVRVSLELFHAEYGYLILVDEDGALNFHVRQDKYGVELPEPNGQISHTILEKVIQKQESLIIADAILDPEFQTSKSVQALQLRSVMCVPMISRGTLLGAIYIENRSEKQLFTHDDLLPLQYFAAQAAIAIENAILNEDLEQRVRQRTAQHEQTNIQLEEEINARKQIEIELRKLSHAVEQSPNPVIITNTAGQIEYVNPAFTRLTGYTREDVIGKNPNIQKSGRTPLAVYEDLWKTIAEGKIWRGEFMNRKKNGELYWEAATIAPIRDDSGNTTHYVAVKEDISERKRIEEKLIHFATIDSLTNIYNRRHLFELSERVFKQALRYQRSLSAMMIDVDHFKMVNDMYGHAIGDRVLQRVAQYFGEHIRSMDILGRYGGEEFAIIMPETDLSQAYQVAERLLAHFNANPVDTYAGELPITISIGVAEMDHGTAHRIDTLLAQADTALYIAKQAGRNRVALFNSSK
ncbi:MAG TPA: diguanylate cyclase [Anaerolineales bacterium]|nr:diguanylate cyclase [Anaerolineales bacterium]